MNKHDQSIEHDFASARRGAVIASAGKTRVTMYLDNDILGHFRALATSHGRGYQTEINLCLRRQLDDATETPHGPDLGEAGVEIRFDTRLPTQDSGAAFKRALGSLHTASRQAA